MRSAERAMARKQLDKRLDSLRDSSAHLRPPKGWVRAIREALGMSAAQLAKRIGVTKSRIYELEKAEITGSTSLESLERAAHAMDCQLIYAFVPKKPLTEMIQERAAKLARRQRNRAAHTMALEDQTLLEEDQKDQLESYIRKLIESAGTNLWDEPDQ